MLQCVNFFKVPEKLVTENISEFACLHNFLESIALMFDMLLPLLKVICLIILRSKLKFSSDSRIYISLSSFVLLFFVNLFRIVVSDSTI